MDLFRPCDANRIIREGLIILGPRCPTRKLLPEPIRCIKCQSFEGSHFTKDCMKLTDTCGTCAGNHRTKNCEVSSSDQCFCANCQELGHAAWDRECPVYITKAKKYQSTSLTLVTDSTRKEKTPQPGNSNRTLTTHGWALPKTVTDRMCPTKQTTQGMSEELPGRGNDHQQLLASHAPSLWTLQATLRPNSQKHGTEQPPDPHRGSAASASPPLTGPLTEPPHPSLYEWICPKAHTFVFLATECQQVPYLATRPT